ncbi:MAG: hypothetical protein WB869_01600 [Candidatus Acidiferrales bacterium]
MNLGSASRIGFSLALIFVLAALNCAAQTLDLPTPPQSAPKELPAAPTAAQQRQADGPYIGPGAENPNPRVQEQEATYHQPTKGDRIAWVLDSTVGFQSLALGLFSAAFGTAENKPYEYHGTFSGYFKRYGMRLTGLATSNTMEAGLGAIWHEDPRYFRVPDRPFRERVRNTVKLTLLARRPSGDYAPAYARYIAIPSSNFLSNTWRANSEANTQNALIRTGFGVVGRFASNAVAEFWPDVSARIHHRQQ